MILYCPRGHGSGESDNELGRCPICGTDLWTGAQIMMRIDKEKNDG